MWTSKFLTWFDMIKNESIIKTTKKLQYLFSISGSIWRQGEYNDRSITTYSCAMTELQRADLAMEGTPVKKTDILYEVLKRNFKAEHAEHEFLYWKIIKQGCQTFFCEKVFSLHNTPSFHVMVLRNRDFVNLCSHTFVWSKYLLNFTVALWFNCDSILCVWKCSFYKICMVHMSGRVYVM